MEGDFVLFEVHHITCYFNPLPPYGGRHYNMPTQRAMEIFQSTPSVWRETAQSIAINSDYKISIHSLRMEGDADAEAEARGEGDFNPLPPYGGRHFPEQSQDSN